MKIVFLDFDGVLNSRPFLIKSRSRMSKSGWREDPTDDIDPQAVGVLNDIIARSGAKVVISSSWRLFYGHDDLRRFLKERGLQGEPIIGQTPERFKMSDRWSERGHEIQQWLDDNKELGVESFVILDDNSDMAHLMDKLVKTDFDEGLLASHVETVLARLG